MASSLFSLRASQSSRTTSVQVLFGLLLGLGPSTSYCVHFFTQSSSSFRSTCPYQRSLFCCNTNVCRLYLVSLSAPYFSFNLTPHIHLTIFISARWSATTFSFLTGQVSLPCWWWMKWNEYSKTHRVNDPVIVTYPVIGTFWNMVKVWFCLNTNLWRHLLFLFTNPFFDTENVESWLKFLFCVQYCRLFYRYAKPAIFWLRRIIPIGLKRALLLLQVILFKFCA